MTSFSNELTICSLNVQSVLDAMRFSDMYNWMMTNGADILMIQDSRITNVEADNLERRYPLISINTSCKAGKGSVSTVIKKSTTQWGISTHRGIITQGGDGRLLVCEVLSKGKTLVVANVYLPTKADKRSKWLLRANQFYKENPLVLPVDIFAGDWNVVESRLDKTSTKPVNQADVARLKSFLGTLGREAIDYVDGWRLEAGLIIEYTHKNSNKGSSRLDRIYVREDWLPLTKNWDIKITGLRTDHLAVTVQSDIGSRSSRGPGRWRMNPLQIKSKAIMDSCMEALAALPSVDPMVEWLTYKASIGKTLSEKSKQQRKTLRRTMETLKRHRRKLVAKRKLGASDPELEQAIIALASREGCQAEHEYRSYAYNSLAKQKLLGEKPTKWFFAKAKNESRASYNIPWLADSTGKRVKDPQEMLRVGEQFYENLYGEKQPEPEALASMLSFLKNEINPTVAAKLSKPISESEIRSSIGRAATGKSPGKDGLPSEFYKALATVKGRTIHNPLIVHLQAVFNNILKTGQAPSTWVEGVLSVLYKGKGEADQLKNYRPLTIMNVDYKIFTEILMRRLLKALEGTIGHHQTAYLKGRLIDDNVRTIQYTVDKYKDDENEGIHLLFLDQEKAFDRVSHRFLWAALKQLGIPRLFINCIKGLYRNASVVLMLNGYAGRPIRIRSGVRQGDPISCPLFLVAIECLAQAIIQSVDIRGIDLSTQLKCVLYADDIVVLLRNQAELDALMEIISTYGKASGSRVNWEKSYTLPVGAVRPLNLPEVKIISPAQPYEHLGIPVGTQIKPQITQFWENTLARFKKIADFWLKSHMSLKGRVLIGNSLMMSIPRYALKFLEVQGPTAIALEKEYYRLIWDDKYRTISDIQSCCPAKVGGIGCLDLHCIQEAIAVTFMARMESRQDLHWVQLAIQRMIDTPSRTKLPLKPVLHAPWYQAISVRPPKAEDSLRHITTVWYHLWAQRAERGPIQLRPPTTTEQVLGTCFWYHPDLRVTQGVGARRFNTTAMKSLCNEGAMLLGDLWDPETHSPIIPDGLGATQAKCRAKEIIALCNDFPQAWKDLLHSGNTVTGPLSLRKELCLFVENKHFDIAKCSFRTCYRAILAWKCRNVDFSEQTRGPARAYAMITGRKISDQEVWKAARNQFVLPKSGDLLWRLLHNKVRTGKRLTWLSKEQQHCPIDGCDLTIEHIWIECLTAQAVWQEFSALWEFFGTGKANIPKNKNELLALWAVGPYKSRLTNRRWRILYTTLVWCLWKAYLSFSFGESLDTLNPNGMRAHFRLMVLSKIHTDRTLSLNQNYTGKDYNAKVFEELWGEAPAAMRVSAQPLCLRPKQK